jgi:anthranilate synthase component 2
MKDIQPQANPTSLNDQDAHTMNPIEAQANTSHDEIFELKGSTQKSRARWRLLMIDNYDSFTFNLVQYFAELGARVQVKRNDEISVAEIERIAPDRLVISPGPCSPKEAGVSIAAIQAFGARIPTLGVCLGHQSIGAALGAKVVRAKTLMHGKTSRIEHLGQGVFKGLPMPLVVNRYHSLAIERQSCPEELEVTAWSEDGEIMGVRHRSWPLEGVQFHPESILSEAGHEMLENFLLQR